jgi:tRNA(fMet)-specific endonuclease VapC
MCGLYHTPSKRKQTLFDELCERGNTCGLQDFSENLLWNEAARIFAGLKRKGITIDRMDILIAAFCLANDLVLVTGNVKHFEYIDGLKACDWME